MKKLIILILTFFTMLLYSYNDGRYTVVKNYDNVSVEMTLIIRNNKILSISFDKKINGVSKYVGSNSSRLSKIIREIRNNGSLEGVEFNLDATTNSEIKELFNFLVEKTKNNEQGKFEIDN